MKKLLLALFVVLFGFSLVACGNNDKPSDTVTPSDNTPTPSTETPTPTQVVEEAPDSVEGTLKIWVGSESKDFYQKICNEWITAYNEKAEEGKKFIGTIEVSGVDSSAAASTYLQDTDKGADIFTVPHDNLGKLLAGSGSIASIKSNSLLDQMEEQCSDAFLDVVYLQSGDGSAAEYYAVPYISQALVYMYNKADFAGNEDKLATLEGILEVAKAKNKLAVCYTGTDGYNFSNFLLAQPKNDAAKEAFGSLGSLRIYDKGNETGCYNYGDDQVAIMKYAQRFVLNEFGRKGELVSADGYELDLQNNKALGVITGAWNYQSACKAMGGVDKVGVAQLPSFTLTAADEYGKAKAGMEFWSGSFADCKVFVKKKDSAFAGWLDVILKHLTSDAIQTQSFAEANNLPASKNVSLGDNELAAAQVASAQHGIPQPFGYKPSFNDFYYSHQTPDIYKAIVQNENDGYTDDAVILKSLQQICWTWEKGTNPSSDEVLQKWVNRRAGNWQ